MNDSRSECTEKVTADDSPAASFTRVKPTNWVTGRVTLATDPRRPTGRPRPVPISTVAYDATLSSTVPEISILIRAGAEILVIKRGGGLAVPERERRGRVQVAYPLAVLAEGSAR